MRAGNIGPAEVAVVGGNNPVAVAAAANSPEEVAAIGLVGEGAVAARDLALVKKGARGCNLEHLDYKAVGAGENRRDYSGYFLGYSF